MTEDIKVDIFKLLHEIDSGNINFYQSLSEQQQKNISPLVTMRWMSGTKNKNQITLINNLLNPFVYRLSKHKSLLYKLMCISSTGTQKTYSWVVKASKIKTTCKIQLLMDTYGISPKSAVDYVDFFDEKDYLDMADKIGYDDDMLKKLKNEFK